MAVHKEAELVIKLDNFFQSSLEHPAWVNWRKNAQKAFEYKEGKQWSSMEEAELTKRKQPATVNNQVAVMLDWMAGKFVQNRTRIAYRGRNPEDDKLAEIYSKLFLHAAQQNDLQFEKKDMASDGFCGGFGCLETFVDFNDALQPQIRINHEDCFNIFPDPYSKKYDWNIDANFICRAKWMELDEAKELWSKKKKELDFLVGINPEEASAGGNSDFRKENYIDFKYKRVRPVEVWYKVKKKEVKLLTPDGRVIDVTGLSNSKLKLLRKEMPGSEILTKVRTLMKTATFIGDVLLEGEQDSPYQHGMFPFIPYFVFRKKDGEPYSKVLIGMPMQDAINYREAKALVSLTQNQVFFEDGAVEDEDDLAKQLALSDGQIKIKRGYFDKVVVEKNTDLAVTHMSFHQQAILAFKQITGVNQEAFGEKSEIRSGIGIQRKQAATETNVSDPFDNLIRTDIILARIVQSLAKQYYKAPQVLTITDDLKATEAFSINNGEDDTLNTAKEGLFDVVAETVPNTSTMQQEEFEYMLQYMPQINAMGPGFMKMAIQMSNLRNKDDHIAQLEQMQKEPPQKAKMNLSLTWGDLQPIEKAHFAMEMGSPELAEAIMQNPNPTLEETKIMLEKMKKDLDMRQAGEKHEMDMEKKVVELEITKKKGANVQRNTN